MKKILKGAGASALAAATVFTGLSFGPAAMATPAPKSTVQASTKTNPANGTEVHLSTADASGKFWGGYKTSWYTKSFSTQSQAIAASGTVKVVSSGDYFRLKITSSQWKDFCLFSNANQVLSGATYACSPDGSAADQLFSLDSQGRLEPKNRPGYYLVNPTSLYPDKYTFAKSGEPARLEGLATLNAQVDSVDVLNRTAAISGYAKADSSVILGENQEADVDADGKWSATLTGLSFGDNTIHLENWVDEEKEFETDLTVTVTVADLTATTAAGASNTDNITISGAGQAGADVTIKNADGKPVATTTIDPETGKYAAQVAAPNAGGNHTFTVTQSIKGADAGSTDAVFNYGTAVSVTKPADELVHPGGPLDFAGKGTPKGTITISEEGKQGALATGTVLANGNWAISGVIIDKGTHKLVVTQVSAGNNTTTSALTLNPGASVIAAPVVDSPEAGSTVEVSRPVFTGHGEPGAKIAIGYSAKSLIGQTTVNASGDWTITPTAGLALGKSDLVVIQTAGTDVQTITYTINRVAAEAPFRVTSHVNNQTYAEGMTTFRGTSASDASIKAVNQWGTVMGSTTADKNGNWAFSRNLGPTTEGYTITFTASKNGKVETETLHLNYQGQVAFQVTSPVNNSVYKEGNTTFVGKASPNTQIKAVNQWGTAMGSATANLDGDWTFSRILGPTTAGYDITFTATKGTDVQRSVLHLNPEVLNVPVQVTSINDGDTYIPGQNILKGTGTPGATVDAVNATNGWNVPMGSAKVGTDGKWELPSRNWGPSNDYAIKVTQTNPDKTKSTVTVNIKAPRFTALTVDNVTIGNPVGAGVTATFTGKASPLATIEVKSANTGSVYQKVTADKDGNWSAARTWDPNHTYNLSFTQKATDGTTDTVDYGTFTAVK